MGNSGTKYNASRGDESGNVEVCAFDLLDRIKIDYVDKQSSTQCNIGLFYLRIWNLSVKKLYILRILENRC